MQVRVLVNGAMGKMGSLASTTIEQHSEFLLVGRLGREDNLAKAIKETNAQIVIDLTRADCVYQNSMTIIESGAHPVIGATGLVASQIATLSSACEAKQLGGVIIPNFSIGAVLMMLCAAKVSEYLSEVEIIETHHQQKQDAPSGTALKTAEMIAKARTHHKNLLHEKELLEGARGGVYEEIHIHSLRLPGTLARQEVLFGNQGETLSITHNSIDRQCFMPGIVLSCQKVLQLNKMIYGLENLL